MHQQEYRAGEITREEYFEWKLNWPDTCDDLGKVTPTIKWRKINKEKQKNALLNFVVQQGGFTCPLQLFSAILFRLT